MLMPYEKAATTQLLYRKHSNIPWVYSVFTGANHTAPPTEMRHAVSVLNSGWTTVELQPHVSANATQIALLPDRPEPTSAAEKLLDTIIFFCLSEQD